MEGTVGTSYLSLSGYSVQILVLGTWQLVGSACERAVSRSVS